MEIPCGQRVGSGVVPERPASCRSEGHVPPGGRGRRLLQLSQVTGGRPGHGATTSPVWKSLETAGTPGRLRGGSCKASVQPA